MKAVLFLLIASALATLTGCGRNNSDAAENVALLDSILGERALLYGDIDVHITGHAPGRYVLLIKGDFDDDMNAFTSGEINFFANNTKLEFSTSVGNYYERHSSFRIYLDEKTKLGDTLAFSIRIRDSINVSAGFLYIKPLLDFIKHRDLYPDVVQSAAKPVAIDWAGDLPDSLTVQRLVVYETPQGKTNESSWLVRQRWHSREAVIIPSDSLRVPGATVSELNLSWWKEQRGQSTDKRVQSFISAVADIDQTIILRSR